MEFIREVALCDRLRGVPFEVKEREGAYWARTHARMVFITPPSVLHS